MSKRLYLVLALIILLTAGALRLTALSQFPPGPHYDEAVYLMMTRSIAFGGARFFPIVEAYQGREVLWMYLNAPLLPLFGDSVLTLRYASAFLNLITVAFAVGIGRAMFPGERGRIIGLTAGAVMALSFPQVWLARQAFRAVTLPLMEGAALWLLFRGLRARHWARWLIPAGIFAGGALYTYMASRLFPLWLALGWAALLTSDWRAPRVKQGIVFFAALALTAAPIGVYAAQKPEIFFGRLAEVTQTEGAVTLGESIVLHLRMFFIEGDPYLRYNIPGRPYFTLPEGLFLLVGLAVCAWRLKRGDAVSRAAALLLLLSPLMVIPSVISVGGLPPSHMRSLGMIPLIFIVVGVGAGALVRYLPKRAFVIGLGTVLLVGGAAVGELYFTWARRADVFYETDADLSAGAKWLASQDWRGRQVYIAARDKGHPTAMIEPLPPVRWLGTDTLFLPPPGVEGVYLFPRSAPPDAWLPWLERGRVTGLPLAPDGREAFEVFRVSGGVLPAPPDSAVRNPYMMIALLDAPPIRAGEIGWLTLQAQISAAPPFPDLTPLVEIIDLASGDRLYRGDAYMTETDRWMPGETMLLRLRAPVPAGTLPGRYAVRLAWVGRSADRYVNYEDGGIWAEIGALNVLYAGWQPETVPHPCAACLAGAAALAGWETTSADDGLRPGETLIVRLYWRAESEQPSAPHGDFCLDGELPLRASGAGLAESQIEAWQRGSVLIERWRVTLPHDLQSGSYTLGYCVGGAVFSLKTILIEGMARVMEAPAVDRAIEANFGGVIDLYGVSLAQSEDELRLTLVWRAAAPMDRAYTMFVHRVDTSGVIIDQRDAPPALPTSLWLAGEYVAETVVFPTDARGEALHIGLYTPDDGRRLTMADGRDYVRLSLAD
jgi:4-amino-4-deoxy-L-arabinose transferase-like glycosyltransferase